LQVNVATAVFICNQQTCTNNNVVFRTVHMAKTHIHKFFINQIWIFFIARQTNLQNVSNPFCVALVADIVSINTFCFAFFFNVTNKTLHHFILFEINQRFFTHNTFFFHNITIFMLAYNMANFNSKKSTAKNRAFYFIP